MKKHAISEESPLLDPSQDSVPLPCSVTQAQVLAEATLARRSDGTLYPLDTPVRDLGKLGVGVGLYFNFVYFATWVMVLQSLLNLPAMISNVSGTAAMSLAERLHFPRNVIAALSIGNHAAGEPVTMHAFIDFVATLAFIVFICVFRRTQVRKAQEIQVANITAADYSVHVTGLPPSATDTHEISSYFSRYGEVARVTISVDNVAILEKIREKDKLLDEIEHWSHVQNDEQKRATARTNKARCHRRIEKINGELQILRTNHQCCTGHAIVTFTLESCSLRCIQDFRQYKRFFGLVRSPMEQSKRFRGEHDLGVDRAPQPSDVIWDHLKYNLFSRLWRQCLTTMLSLFLVLFATGLIAAVNGKHLIFPISHIAVVEAVGLNVVTVMVILGANVFLFIAIPKLAKYEKYHYRSSEEVFVMLRLLLFQVLNTVIASLILWDSSTDQNDETNWLHWYADGGYLVFNIMIGDALLMNAIEFFHPFDIMLNRKYFAKKALTQKDMNRCYELPQYSLGMRYQFTLKAIVVALFFGSGMPIVYIIGALLFFLTYWIDKYNLLRVYRKPPTYDDSVATIAAILVLPLAMVLHLIMGMYFYTTVVECPKKVICAPSATMTLTYILLSFDLAIQIGVWHPLLLRHPDVSVEMVRAREVPYNCVKSIATYDAPKDTDTTVNSQTQRIDRIIREVGNDEDEIGISVF